MRLSLTFDGFNFMNSVFSIDPFTRKDWYNVRAPCMFTNRDVGKTLVNRTQGTSECFRLILKDFIDILRLCIILLFRKNGKTLINS